MSDHVTLAIEELNTKIATITDLRDKLVAFRQEWPHAAAAMTLVSHGTGVHLEPKTGKRKYTRRTKAGKGKKQASKQGKARAGEDRRGL